MRGDVRNAQQQYTAARDALALRDGELRSRLAAAYDDHVSRTRPREGGAHAPLPEALVERMSRFHHTMGGAPRAPSTGAAVAAMDDDEVDAAAKELCELAARLDEAFWTDGARRAAQWDGIAG